MSSRGGGGRGGGRGGDRAQGQWQQQSPSSDRGGGGRGRRGGGRGGGQGRGESSSGGRAPGWSGYSAHTPSQSVSSSSLSSEVEQKLTLQPPASTSAWARPRSSTQPQPAPAAQSVQPQVSPPVQEQQQQQQQQLVSPPMSSKAIRPPRRPGHGTIGHKCLVRANHFIVQVADRDLHHYDVTISPEVTNKKKCRDIIAELVKNYKDSYLGNRMLAYDGRKSAYTGGPLPFSSKEFLINLVDSDSNGRERQFKVSIKFAAKADLDHLQQFLRGNQLDAPQETIQALDVALRAMPSSTYEAVGRSFFSPNLGNYGELGNGVEYWTGFYQSLRPTQMGLSLNIDMSARGFYEPILVSDFVAKYWDRDIMRPLSDQDRVKLRKALKGVKVELNHQGYKRRCKISGLSAQQTQHIMFIDETGVEKSVVQYFQEKYRIRLRFTSLPALQSGSDARPVYLPMEICKIVAGQRYSRKLNKDQVAKLLRANCQRPDARERSVREMVRHNNYNGNVLVSKEFGIQVMPELTSVEARVLPPPMLKYHGTGRGSLVEPRVGQWNMRDKKLINGAKVEFWTCVSFARSSLDVVRFCNELISVCCNKGMEFNHTPLLPISSANPAQLEKVLSDIHTQSRAKLASMEQHGKELQLLIVVLPDGTGIHGRIKKKCETDLGIVSQCVLAKQALKNPMSYLENLALKINVKAGGRNCVLERAVQRNIPYLTEHPTIVFGADVTHPHPGEDSSPSIAAVVASMDWPEVTKYKALVSAQSCREEIIQDLGALVRELLLGFWRSTRFKPHRIIFYRDGVSEGQFNEVLLREMDAIRQACNNLEQNYQPRVTFVVVQKRHHTRLFPERHGDQKSTDRSGNILPGTVVDTKICHPTDFDFYLCSHAGIQGTSRPTHYHVLYDENKFTADGLQMLTNSLCYTYARCTRSVSIVPPAYYAHLAAFRAREYAEGEFSDSGSTSEGRATRDKRDFQPLPPIKDNVKDVMFYC